MKKMNHTNSPTENVGANPLIEDAIEFSENYKKRYLQERVSIDNGVNEADVMHLACARLQWMLDRTRLEVSGIFSEDEFMILLDCNMDRFFSPDSFTAIPSVLCDHYGIELDDYEETHLKFLVNKLRELDGMQFLALGDAMEQSWHRGLKSGKTVREFLLTLGIELA
jgi:hypothetical protein